MALTNYAGEVAWTFRVTGETAQDRFHNRPVQVAEVKIRFAPRRIDGTGGIYWGAKVTGFALKKDGTPGTQHVEHSFTGTMWTDSNPAWLTALAKSLEPLAHQAITAPMDKGL